MAESLFDIFGDRHSNRMKNVARQPISDIENMGKKHTIGPIKPNEPLKKAGEPKKSFLSNTGKAKQPGEPKKSFFSNAGKALQTPVRNVFTPTRNVFTPRAVNITPAIYTDNKDGNDCIDVTEIEFTKPSAGYVNYQKLHPDIPDYLLPSPIAKTVEVTPKTPPPVIKPHSFMELDCSYSDEFYKDDFSLGSCGFSDEDLDTSNLLL